MLMTVSAVAGKGKFTLVIDAGHGGNDAGAIGKITKEKIINLNVALAVGRLVEHNCPDVKVIYTRKTDVFIPLHTRADIANRNKADLFISIHTNALPKKRISRGLETYTLGMHRAADNLEVAKRENEVILYEKDYKQRYQGFDPNSSESYIMFEFMQDHNMAQSVELAKFVQKRTCAAAGRLNKGVKQAGFLVLRETSMPSCLIELGFISTPDEERFLNSRDGVSQLARGIYQAFLDYKRKYDGNVSVNQVEPQSEASAPAMIAQTEVKDKKQLKQEREQQEKLEKEKKRLEKEQKKLERERKKQEERAEKQARQRTMAQELADAREGKNVSDVEPGTQPATPSVDSIIAAAPVLPDISNEAVKKEEQSAMPQVSHVASTVTTPAASEAKQSSAEQGTGVSQAMPSAATETPLVFKIQIMACDVKLRPKDPRLKGLTHVSFYQEGGLYKYTVGDSEDYNEIVKMRKTLTAKFPQAFIVAFRGKQKVNVQAAIQEYKAKK